MGDRTAHESRFAHAGKAEIAHLLAATRRNRSSSLRSTETPLRAIRQPFQEPLLNSLHVRAEFGLWARHACAAGCAIFMRMAGSTPMGTKKAPAFAKPRLRGDVRRRRRNKRGLTRIRDRGMKGPTQFPARASGAGPKSRAFIEAPFLARKLRLGGVVSRGSGRFAIRSSPCLSCPPMIPSA